MENILFHRVLAYLNILALIVLVIDSYIVPAPVREIFDHDETIRGARNVHFMICGTSGDKIEVPANTDMALEPGDTFYVQRSGLFKTQIGIIYPGPDKVKETYNRAIVKTLFGKIAIILIIAISVLNAGRVRKIREKQLNERLILAGFMLTLILAACQFFL